MTGRGRPAIGTGPELKLRLFDDQLAAIDQLAETEELPRAEVIRMALDYGLRTWDQLKLPGVQRRIGTDPGDRPWRS